MCFSVYDVLSSQTGLVALLATGLGLCAALAYLYTKFKPQQEEEEPEAVEAAAEPRKLRTRPLKPAIDLSIYKYRTDLH